MRHHYSAEPRDYHSSLSSHPRQRSSPPINERMASAADRADPAGHDGVSPELIAAITDKVKKERKFQHTRLGAFSSANSPYQSLSIGSRQAALRITLGPLRCSVIHRTSHLQHRLLRQRHVESIPPLLQHNYPDLPTQFLLWILPDQHHAVRWRSHLAYDSLTVARLVQQAVEHTPRPNCLQSIKNGEDCSRTMGSPLNGWVSS